MFGFRNKTQSFDNILPIFGIEDEFIILKDGRVALLYSFSGAPAESLTEVDFSKFQQFFSNAFLELPIQYIVQKIDIFSNAAYISSSEISARPPASPVSPAFLVSHASSASPISASHTDQPLFQKETIRHFQGRDVLRQRSYLAIISDTENANKKNALSTLLASSSYKGIDEKKFLKIDQRKKQLLQISNTFVQSLNAIGFVQLTKTNAEEFKILLNQFLNFEFNRPTTYPERIWLNNRSHLTIGEKKVSVISLQDFGDEAHVSVKNNFGVLSPFLYRLGIYLQFPHVTVISLLREDTNRLLTQFDRTRAITQATQRLNPQQSQLKVQELFELTHHVRKNELNFLSLSLSVVVGSASETQLTRMVNTVNDAIKTTDGLKPLVESFDTCNSFIAAFPCCASESIRWLTATADIATCFINPTTEFHSRDSGDFICDRFRNLIYIDLFNRKLNNQNAIVVGPSGSGKSFAMGHFILQRFERKDRQVIIDVGGTYKNIFEGLDNPQTKDDLKYFEYTPENPISFNPFLGPKDPAGNYLFDDDKANVLLTLFGIILKDTQSNATVGALSKSEWPVYEQLLSLYYKHINNQNASNRQIPTLAHFVQWAFDAFQSKTFSAQMHQYLIQVEFEKALVCFQPYTLGRYHQLLNADYTQDLSNYRLICFDMARVKEVPALYPIVSFLLIELSMEIIRRFPEERKYVVMDEAWSMLSDAMGGFVEYLYRTIRKTNGSMTIVTQGVDELATDIGSIIKSKCETKIILNHSSLAEIEKVGNGLGLTHSEKEKVQSIRVASDCRELFIKQGTESAVYVLEVPIIEHAILTSNPVERNHLHQLKQLYSNLGDALHQWQEDKQQGFFEDK